MAVVHLDLLSGLAQEPCTLEELRERAGVAPRPADVMCTLFRAMGLLEPGPVLRLTPLAARYLVRGSPTDLGPYLAALGERGSCLELLEVLRTDKPPSWASTPMAEAPTMSTSARSWTGGRLPGRCLRPPGTSARRGSHGP